MAIILWTPHWVAAQTISFNPYQIKSSNESFWVISNGNINNDNLDDLCLGSTNSSIGNNYQIKTFLQSPDPLIGLYPGYYFNYPITSNGIVSIKLGDLNNDTLHDLVIAYEDVVQIYLNNSGIQFLYVTKNVGATTCDVAIGDINEDGLQDIVVGTYSGIKILYQTSTGSFPVTDYEYNNHGWGLLGLCSVEIADVEGNGGNDIVWLSRSYSVSPRTISIIPRVNGKLGLPCELFYTASADYFPTSFVATELDNDPGIDIAVSFSSSNPLSAGEIAVWNSLNLWTNPYASDTIYTNRGSQVLKADDLDKDGTMDLIQIYKTNEISILNQDSGGEFSEICFPLPVSTSGYSHESIEIGDYNNDTCNDIAIADLEFGLVVLYQENTTSGLESINSLPVLKIFPNPISDYFELKSINNGQLEIIDFSGRIVFTQKVNHDIRVDCSKLVSGAYLVKLTDQTGIKKAKIIKR